ncbi:xylulokinase [Sulfitobacter mediterraneus]|uniref:xylulokinase n=1 Tax=Sulfitobacter mediterraneus TaxID=83219 RepID=UPI001932D874|nr:xylulokinase [Sulfitobacter mediterraneus]MBM1310682.1 xylulokinase [Sulfitobacter mediterraneus]MBM1314566.1 xylulokinase [Sulfitobacter mediterraneus]MBM1322926.1 xylulokinase [Sulfitobacter mediterraneus]MBM1326838.1 xylulokinase [Sulfitobacter mediterraneus]MBM1398184.1 xylulokinase [Sulfitobacter mediterraneus]
MYLGLDLGTSGVKALLIDDAQSPIAEGHAPLTVERPHPNWSEQDPNTWITACEAAIAAVRAEAPQAFAALKGIAVSGQMHGATLLDEADNPLRPAILWNDGRSAEQCEALEARADFRAIGGNIVMAGFTAPKLEWVRQNEPEVFAKARKVLLPKDYVGLWLTGRHMSEMSDAAGTLWLDVGKRDWSDALLAATGLDRSHMPQLVEGSEIAGNLRPELAKAWGVGSVVVAGGAGDNAATACGLGITKPGDAFVSLGTSGVLFTTTDHYATNTKSAVHSFCHALPDTWHQMGVILSATDSLNWLADLVGRSAKDLTTAIDDLPSAASPVTFLPYLSGERTPHNAPDASASFLGLKRQHGLTEMTQAVMEGVAFALNDCRRAIDQSGTPLTSAWVAGGGSQSKAWLNMIAAATGLTLKVPTSGSQGAALGAARLAMAASGMTDVFGTPDLQESIAPDPALAAIYAERQKLFRSVYPALP